MYRQVSKLIRVKKVSKWGLVGGARRKAETRVTIRKSLTICYVIRLQSPRCTPPVQRLVWGEDTNVAEEESDRKVVGAEWHLSSSLLSPAQSVNLFFPSRLLLRSATRSPDVWRRHPSPFYTSKSIGCLMQSKTGAQSQIQSAGRDFNSATFLWFCWLWSGWNAEGGKKTNAGMKTAVAQYMWDGRR